MDKKRRRFIHFPQIFTRAESILYLDVPLYNYRTTNRESMTKSLIQQIFKSSTAVRKKFSGIWAYGV